MSVLKLLKILILGRQTGVFWTSYNTVTSGTKISQSKSYYFKGKWYSIAISEIKEED